MTLPAYIIHSSHSTDRESLVASLQEKTGGTVVEAIWLKFRKLGCSYSHIKVAALAKQNHPDSAYLVFEDDCILKDTWTEALDYWSYTYQHDELVYLGYNETSDEVVFGTHALLITPRVRDLILAHTESYIPRVQNVGAYDWILNRICTDFNVRISLPPSGEKWCYQQKGLLSTITGTIRR